MKTVNVIKVCVGCVCAVIGVGDGAMRQKGPLRCHLELGEPRGSGVAAVETVKHLFV